MSAGFGIDGKFTGVADVMRRLRALPDKLQRKVKRKALEKATKPTLLAARRLAPKESGLLKKSVARKTATYKASGTIVAMIGPRRGMKRMVTREGRRWPRYADPVHYAHLAEYGTRPHALGKGSRLARVGPGAAKAAAARAKRLARWQAELRKATNPARHYQLQQRIAKQQAAEAARREAKQAGRLHPGTRARPFLRPAFDATKEQVRSIFVAEVLKGLEAEMAGFR